MQRAVDEISRKLLGKRDFEFPCHASCRLGRHRYISQKIGLVKSEGNNIRGPVMIQKFFIDTADHAVVRDSDPKPVLHRFFFFEYSPDHIPDTSGAETGYRAVKADVDA